MNKEKPDKSGSLSIEETKELLGADTAIEIGELRPDPITLSFAGELVKARLVSRGGRPTDPQWDISRKIPMRSSNWEKLRRRSEKIKEEGMRVSPGQLAAYALELGLPQIIKESPSDEDRIESEGKSEFVFSPEIEEESELVCAAIQSGGIW